MARRLAWRFVARDGLTEDVVQESLLQAYLSLRHGEVRSRVHEDLAKTSLTGGASVLAQGGSLELVPDDGEFDPHERLEQREMTAAVLRAVEALSAKDRQATLLFYFEALSVREVADALGISAGAVRVHLHNARDLLRQRLETGMSAGRSRPQARPSKHQNRKDMTTVADIFEFPW